MNHIFIKGENIVSQSFADVVKSEHPDFKVQKVLDGGMGTCACIASAEGKKFAVKMLHTDILQMKQGYDRYKDELKIWYTLSSCDSVCNALGVSQYNDLPCIISEWMEGGDLTNYLPVRDHLLFYHTFDRIITALQWVYTNHGIIHRDLKPQNILFDKHYNCYIADWGLAKDLTLINEDKHCNVPSCSDNDRTSAGSFLGTVSYASPEQIRGDKSIDFRSDIYSIGCMMYYWECGHLPFTGNTIQEIAYNHLFKEPFVETNHFKVGKIIERCLKKNPTERYNSYQELLDDFVNVANQHFRFKKYEVSLRYERRKIDKPKATNLYKKYYKALSNNGKYGFIPEEVMYKDLEEAQVLFNLGESKKSLDIYLRYFFPEFVIKYPDEDFHQFLTNNIAILYKDLGYFQESVNILNYIKTAQNKRATYYVNLSLGYISIRDYAQAELVAREGLQVYPNDLDILGNLAIALSNQGKCEEALSVAEERLSINRDTHSMRDLAVVHRDFANKIKNKDFPKAIEHYRESLRLLEEVISLNPRDYWERCNMAACLCKLKRYKDAMDVLDKLNSDLGHSELLYYWYAYAAHWMDLNDFCVNICKKGLEYYPNSILLSRIMNRNILEDKILPNFIAHKEIYINDCLSFFEHIVKDSANRCHHDFICLSKLRMIQFSTDEALKILAEGEKLFPNNWEFEFQKAGFYLGINDLQNAYYSATLANQLAPWRESTYDRLSDVYNLLGDSAMKDFYHSKADEIYAFKQKLYLEEKIKHQ